MPLCYSESFLELAMIKLNETSIDNFDRHAVFSMDTHIWICRALAADSLNKTALPLLGTSYK